MGSILASERRRFESIAERHQDLLSKYPTDLSQIKKLPEYAQSITTEHAVWRTKLYLQDGAWPIYFAEWMDTTLTDGPQEIAEELAKKISVLLCLPVSKFSQKVWAKNMAKKIKNGY